MDLQKNVDIFFDCLYFLGEVVFSAKSIFRGEDENNHENGAI